MLNYDRAFKIGRQDIYCECCDRETTHDIYWDEGKQYAVCDCGTVIGGEL